MAKKSSPSEASLLALAEELARRLESEKSRNRNLALAAVKARDVLVYVRRAEEFGRPEP